MIEHDRDEDACKDVEAEQGRRPTTVSRREQRARVVARASFPAASRTGLRGLPSSGVARAMLVPTVTAQIASVPGHQVAG